MSISLLLSRPCNNLSVSVRTCSRFYYVNSQLLENDVKMIVKPIRCYASAQTTTITRRHKVLRFMAWMGGYYSRKSILSRSAYSLYAQCIDEVDYESFFKEVQMPDTFHSWFLIAHLHAWLCMVRLQREDKDGKYLNKQIGSLFWRDVEERMKLLGVGHIGSNYNGIIKNLANEFRGLVVAYEEGLLTDDRRLAAAIWRNLIDDKTNTDFEIVSRVLCYIRAQVQEMDTTNSEDMKNFGKMNLLPLSLKQSL